MGLAFSDGCRLAMAWVQRGKGETWTSKWAVDSGTEPLHVPNKEPGDAVSFSSGLKPRPEPDETSQRQNCHPFGSDCDRYRWRTDKYRPMVKIRQGNARQRLPGVSLDIRSQAQEREHAVPP